jgi:hypothetical protein
MPTKSKKRPGKKATPKTIPIKLNQKQKEQVRKDLNKHGIAKFKIQELDAIAGMATSHTVHSVVVT